MKLLRKLKEVFNSVLILVIMFFCFSGFNANAVPNSDKDSIIKNSAPVVVPKTNKPTSKTKPTPKSQKKKVIKNLVQPINSNKTQFSKTNPKPNPKTEYESLTYEEYTKREEYMKKEYLYCFADWDFNKMTVNFYDNKNHKVTAFELYYNNDNTIGINKKDGIDNLGLLRFVVPVGWTLHESENNQPTRITKYDSGMLVFFTAKELDRLSLIPNIKSDIHLNNSAPVVSHMKVQQTTEVTPKTNIEKEKEFMNMLNQAERGKIAPQYYVASNYEYRGRDYKKAYIWYYILKLSGRDTSYDLKLIRDKLTKSQISEAETEARKKFDEIQKGKN